MQPRVTLSSQSSCLCLQNAEITAIQQGRVYFGSWSLRFQSVLIRFHHCGPKVKLTMAVDGTKPLTSWAEAETDRIRLRQDTQGLTLGCWIVLPMFRAGLCKHPYKHAQLCGLLISKISLNQTKLMITQLSMIPFRPMDIILPSKYPHTQNLPHSLPLWGIITW